MGIETGTAVLLGSVLAAGAGVATSEINRADARRQRRAQERLENQRRAELQREAAAREAAAARAATAGQRVGLSATAFGEGLGFGSGTTQSGLGQGRLFS